MTFTYYVVVNHSLKVVYEPCYEQSAAESFKAGMLAARPGDDVDIIMMSGDVMS